MSSLPSVHARLTAVLHEHTSAQGVAGAVVGADVGGEQIALAHGTANLNTGQEFTTDTGFLLGSVTKVLTATMVMRLVERGAVDLDEPVKRYVPEFALSDAEAARRITVRMLINHTNGIDADTLNPSAVRGRDASRSCTIEHLPRRGVLFEPGTGIHYSNPGFVVAARVIEECTGLPYERAIQRELFDPAGMDDATAIQTQAFLRRTAIGAFADPDKGLRATTMFTLHESGAGSGATLIVSVADMLAFGRVHLNGGVAATGRRVLSSEFVDAMRSPTYDLGIPQAPPIGLGWWLVPIAGTTAAQHGGGSPGGSSSFCILPEYDATIVSFVAGPGGLTLNDALHNAAIEEITGRQVTRAIEPSPTAVGENLTGEYASFERRLIVDAKGDELVVTDHYEPYDEDHRRRRHAYAGHADHVATVRYTSVAPGQFAPAGTEPGSLGGFFGRLGLLAGLPATPGRRPGLHGYLRYIPKVG